MRRGMAGVRRPTAISTSPVQRPNCILSSGQHRDPIRGPIRTCATGSWSSGAQKLSRVQGSQVFQAGFWPSVRATAACLFSAEKVPSGLQSLSFLTRGPKQIRRGRVLECGWGIVHPTRFGDFAAGYASSKRGWRHLRRQSRSRDFGRVMKAESALDASPTSMCVLVVAPHPDDEVLGAGGFLALSASAGATVHVAIVTRGRPPLFSEEQVRRVRAEARRAHGVLGVHTTHFLDNEAAALDQVPHRELNAQMTRLFQDVRPDGLLLPFPGDLHKDHELVFRSALVAARPDREWAPKWILAYETLSETNWNAPHVSPPFIPQVFVDISDYLDVKLAALQCYGSQVRPAPHERSLEAVRVLAVHRGATIGVPAAEAFLLVRLIDDSATLFLLTRHGGRPASEQSFPGEPSPQ